MPKKLISLFIFFILLPLTTQANVILIEKTDYYNINGTDGYELKEQMELLGPKTLQGQPVNADTKWDVKWNYKLKEINDRCQLRHIKVKLYVTYHLPEWQNFDEGPPELQKEWNDYLKGLVDYEKERKKIALLAAKKVLERLVSLSSESSCSKLSRRAEIIAKQTLDQHKSMDETRHWRTQGGKGLGVRFLY